MAEIGFFGLTIPEEYGGLGGDYLTYVLAMEELGRADSALRGIVSVSNGPDGVEMAWECYCGQHGHLGSAHPHARAA